MDFLLLCLIAFIPSHHVARNFLRLNKKEQIRKGGHCVGYDEIHFFLDSWCPLYLGSFTKSQPRQSIQTPKRMECWMKFDLCAPPAYSFFARVVSWVQVNVYVNWSERVVSVHYWDRSPNIQERLDWINNSCIALQFKLVTTVDELKSYIDRSQLTPEFGGVFHYDHDEWIRFRIVSNACNCKWNFLPKLSNLSNYRK